MKRNLVTVGLLSVTLALAATAIAGPYTAGGTFVVKSGSTTIVDNGGAICQGLSGGGIGGGCMPFPLPNGRDEGGFVGVIDASAANKVAFQVCLDNNGDGVCGGQFLPTDTCPDQIFFSHSDGGVFHNPLGPLPTHTLPGCGTAFQGYVVLLCQGTHNDNISGPHTHTLSSGQIFAAPGGTGYGNFCGGGSGGATGIDLNTAAKAYKVV